MTHLPTSRYKIKLENHAGWRDITTNDDAATRHIKKKVLTFVIIGNLVWAGLDMKL